MNYVIVNWIIQIRVKNLLIFNGKSLSKHNFTGRIDMAVNNLDIITMTLIQIHLKIIGIY